MVVISIETISSDDEDSSTTPITVPTAASSNGYSAQQTLNANPHASDTGQALSKSNRRNPSPTSLNGGESQFGEQESGVTPSPNAVGANPLTSKLKALASAMGNKMSGILGLSTSGNGVNEAGNRKVNSSSRLPSSAKTGANNPSGCN